MDPKTVIKSMKLAKKIRGLTDKFVLEAEKTQRINASDVEVQEVMLEIEAALNKIGFSVHTKNGFATCIQSKPLIEWKSGD